MRTVRTVLRTGEISRTFPSSCFSYEDIKRALTQMDKVLGDKSVIMDHTKLTCSLCNEVFVFGADDYRGRGMGEFQLFQTDFYMHKVDCVNARVERIHA